MRAVWRRTWLWIGVDGEGREHHLTWASRRRLSDFRRRNDHVHHCAQPRRVFGHRCLVSEYLLLAFAHDILCHHIRPPPSLRSPQVTK